MLNIQRIQSNVACILAHTPLSLRVEIYRVRIRLTITPCFPSSVVAPNSRECLKMTFLCRAVKSRFDSLVCSFTHASRIRPV